MIRKGRVTYLIIDCNYLCHRAKHSMGHLSYKLKPTEVIFGFLKTVLTYRTEFRPHNFLFCFDSKTSKRAKLYPDYKCSRIDRYNKKTDEEKQFDERFKKQIKKLRTKYLPMIGFRNIFIQPGYESDDLIAQLALQIEKPKTGIIITSDNDLLQCLSDNIEMFSPSAGTQYTVPWFKTKYNLEPSHWAMVKALAGCTSDDVKGIERVGEVTAVKFLNRTLNTNSQVYAKIRMPKSQEIVKRNMPLVKLPMDGTKAMTLQEDNITAKGWKAVCKELGFRSIIEEMY